MITMDIINNIKYLKRVQGLSYASVKKITGCSYNTIKKYEEMENMTPKFNTPKKPTKWKWYNKVDTKLREFNERWYFMKRKSYDKQFKMAAVKLILEEEVPVSVVAKELEIHQNTLYRWVNEYEEHGESAFPGRGTALYSYQFEIKKLKKENLELKKELELLKKFRAFLKKKNI